MLKYWTSSGQELPNNQLNNYTDMTGNVLLMHMNDNWTDSSGNENNGTASGATFATGKLNNAGNFDGQTDYVDAGNDASLNLQNTITISAWINLDTTAPSHGYHSSIAD